MTAKNVGAKGDTLDRCYSPPWLVDQCVRDVLLPYYADLHPTRILEPSAGAGAFVGAMRTLYPKASIEALDLDPDVGPWKHASASYVGENFLDTEFKEGFDLVIGNPPYSIAQEFIEHALTYTENLVFVMRLGFLSSATRSTFFREYPPSRIGVITNRPSFSVGSGTDSADYCWVCWGGSTDGGRATELFWTRNLPRSIRQI